MKAFVVFDAKTGAIRHVHYETTMEGEERKVDPREVLDTQALGRGDEALDAGGLEVLEVDVDELQAGRGIEVELFVDPERRSLATRDRPKAE
jgi:hypothetical protein